MRDSQGGCAEEYQAYVLDKVVTPFLAAAVEYFGRENPLGNE